MTVRQLSILMIFLLGRGGVCGQSLFSNDITDPNPSAYNPFTLGQTFDTNINVSGIGRGSGILAEASANRYNARSWNTMGIDLDAYFTFTLTPNSNYILNLNSFSYSGQASGTGPTNFAFRSSIDGFVSDIGSPIANGTTIDLSANQFQNITSSIEFRFYGWGASSAAGTFSINDFTFNGSAPLPVELTRFDAVLNGGQVDLTWATASEINNDYFLVQHSTDGARFEDLGMVPGAGTTTLAQAYQWVHDRPEAGANYYRLKQVDFDGQFEYSPIRVVDVRGDIRDPQWAIRPTVTSDMLYLLRQGDQLSSAQWTVLTPDGRPALRGTVAEGASQTIVDVQGLPAGMYFLRVSSREGVWSGRFRKE